MLGHSISHRAHFRIFIRECHFRPEMADRRLRKCHLGGEMDEFGAPSGTAAGHFGVEVAFPRPNTKNPSASGGVGEGVSFSFRERPRIARARKLLRKNVAHGNAAEGAAFAKVPAALVVVRPN